MIFLHGFSLTHFACWNNKTHKFSACCPCCAPLFIFSRFTIFCFLIFRIFIFSFFLFCFAFKCNYFYMRICILFLSLPFVFARVCLFSFLVLFLLLYERWNEGEEEERGGGKRELSRKYAAYNTRTLKTH